MIPNHIPLHRITNNRPHAMTVTWELTTTCNYACWYCPPRLHDGRYRWPDMDIAKRFYAQLADSKSTVHLDLIGGEPTLWPGLDDFLASKPRNLTIEVSTNGSRTIEWWRRNLPSMEYVTISFHPDSADPDHIYRVCELTDGIGSGVHVMIMALASRLDTCLDLYERLEKSPFKISANFKQIDDRNHDMATAIDVTLDARLRDVIANMHFNHRRDPEPNKPTQAWYDGQLFEPQAADILGISRFKDWYCSIGKSRLYMEADGTVWRGSCRSGGPLGNYAEPDLISRIMHLDSHICDRHVCQCLDEIVLEKHSLA